MVILFDFDGTLADSLGLYLTVYNYYLKRHKRPPITKEMFRSLGVLEIAKKEKIPKWELFWIVLIGRIYTARNIHKIKVFPSLPEQLKKLSQNHTLGVVTSNSKRNVRAFLDAHNLSSSFSFLESKVSYFGKAQKISQVIKKYKISKRNCVYVGDEVRDMNAAKKNGIFSVAVTWGFENADIISKSQPHTTITKPSLLYKKLSELFSKNSKRKDKSRI